MTTTYTYNGAGIRVSRAVSGGATVNYAWDAAAALPVILDDGAYRYVYGLDLIAAIEDGGTEHYFLYDGLGSVTEVTDDAGGVEASFRYDIFGAVRASSGSTDLEFRFTGEQLDPSGLYFLRARYYDPATGRFISRDLVEIDQRYAYAGNNPVLYVDANGLCRNPASRESRPLWRRGLDAVDCALDPVTQGTHEDMARLTTEASATVLTCLTPTSRCQEGLEVGLTGTALVAFGFGITSLGCLGGVATGPAWWLVCGESLIAGSASVFAGTRLIVAAFEEWEHGSGHGSRTPAAHQRFSVPPKE